MTWHPSIGALLRNDGVFFRVWAPARKQVDVVINENEATTILHPLTRDADGYWTGLAVGAGAGTHYMFRLDGEIDRPDPASRSQPDGVHGASRVVDPAFVWSDDAWRGVSREQLIIYELHVGAATAAGTFDALIERLPDLCDLGITAIELLPVADFPGERNWGYDGVALYAPAHVYGGGDGLKRLVDAAHAAGLAVILDVVYNHLGPSGNYLRDYARAYFTDRHRTPWGKALNFDSAGSAAVRAFFFENALYWTHEYHIDGLRLDATQEIIDDSAEHLLQELAHRVHASLPVDRHFMIFAEDARNEARLARASAAGGFGLDGIWADDFCHVVRVTLTGEQQGYLYAYAGGGEELATVLRDGWLYQGQPDSKTGAARGTPTTDLAPASFVCCIQNHDQVGNRPVGDRLHHTVTPAAYRAASALLLLAPCTPLLFMGQEWAASSPFLFFTDHDAELGPLITEGRRKEYDFLNVEVPDPQAVGSFDHSKLRWEERSAPDHAPVLKLYRDLIALRKRAPVYHNLQRAHITVKCIGQNAVTLRLTKSGNGEHSLLIAVNLGGTAGFEIDADWRLLLDTEASVYGGAASFFRLSEQIELNGPRALIFRSGG